MKSVFKRGICATCNQNTEAFICRGCHRPFCAKHVAKHRDKITKDMENIYRKCDRLQQEASSDKFAQTILSSIDQWEKKSIEKIRNAAQKVRDDLQPYINQLKYDLKFSLDEITTEMNSRKALKDYTEIELARWNKSIQEVQQIFQKKINIDFIDDDQKQLIHLIQLAKDFYPNAQYNDEQTNSFYQDSFTQSLVYERETFGEIFGKISLSDSNYVATYTGPWNGDAYVLGSNLHSSGIHHLHFRIVDKFYNSPFFGIVSSSQKLVENILNCRSTNGWVNFDYPVINGVYETDRRDRVVQTGDQITLTLDCERRQLFLRHHRTRRLLHLPVDIRLCPFPWKLLIVLRRKGDSIRLQGGALSLSTFDLTLKLKDHLKT